MDINDIVFVSSPNRLPFTSYNEINATIQYDTKLKSLLYGKMMFIETALKNIALNTIMLEIDSAVSMICTIKQSAATKMLQPEPVKI